MSFLFRIASFLGAAGVVLGAMGAHGKVHEILLQTAQLDHWKTASQYHLIHAAALVALSLVAHKGKSLRLAWWAIFLGVSIFSGTLYVLALTGMKWLGAITPIGGLLMIVGWLLAAVGAGKIPSADQAATRS